MFIRYFTALEANPYDQWSQVYELYLVCLCGVRIVTDVRRRLLSHEWVTLPGNEGIVHTNKSFGMLPVITMQKIAAKSIGLRTK